MVYVAKKFQTKSQKMHNRGTNVPYKYLTPGQKRHSGGTNKPRGRSSYRKRSYSKRY